MSSEHELCRRLKLVGFGAEDIDDFTRWFYKQAWPSDPHGTLLRLVAITHRTLERHARGQLHDRTARRTFVHLVDFLQGQAHRVPDALVGVTEAMLDQSYRQVLTMRTRQSRMSCGRIVRNACAFNVRNPMDPEDMQGGRPEAMAQLTPDNLQLVWEDIWSAVAFVPALDGWGSS